jgi:hypothetical protein
MIIKTGEILDISVSYKTMTLSIDLPKNLGILYNTGSDQTIDIAIYNSDKSADKYYLLSDGNNYNNNEVIVGIDNIRDYKLKILQ